MSITIVSISSVVRELFFLSLIRVCVNQIFWVVTESESLLLFQNILGSRYVRKNKKNLIILSSLVGNLPLAVHILAKQLKQSKIKLEDLLDLTLKEGSSIKNLSYENKNLYLALQVNFKNLSLQAKAIFLSFGVFEGKDFSVQAIAYTNGLSLDKTKMILQELYETSLIETSLDNKFRIHPMIKRFIGEKLHNPYISMFNKIILFTFIGFSIYWIFLQATKITDDFNNRLFSSTYFLVALFGACLGIKFAQKWGGIKSAMGKSLLIFAFGLLSQVIGQICYGYYGIILNVDIPYPSLGDIGYFISMPIYLLGVIFLAKTAGVKIEPTIFKKHIISVFLSTCILIVCIWLLLQQYTFFNVNFLKVFLDFIYPIGGWLNVMVAVLVYLELKQIKKNLMKNKIIFFVFALLIQALSDYVFVYQANLGTWHFGQVNDYMYLIVYLFMTFAIIKLNSHLNQIITK